MLISWNWLKTYVELDITAEELTSRLMMAGFNHESTTPVGDDLAIDFEVTSNRPDCLGHLGIARETAVLWGCELRLPAAEPKVGRTPIANLATVAVECPELCPRYIARVIQGVRVAPSPPWLVSRLATIGISAINNIVDVTNFVLMECGQPLHAFDLAKLAGQQIIVRRGRPGEQIEAIDHKTYQLAEMCVIADRDRAVGIAGIMGGAGSEVTGATTSILLESAEFDPSAIRNAARRLNLHSDSSYRFERGLDRQGLDWASRRACQLMLETAGGELASGSIDVGGKPPPARPIVLRHDQLKRILGIEIRSDKVREILSSLGNRVLSETQGPRSQVEVIPPSWRRDLEREIDLIEEVARIYGYEAIPEDVSVPMAPSARSADDRVLDRVRSTLTAIGYDEALTVSVVDEAWSDAFTPWTDAGALQLSTPLLRRADRLRRSLVPSLLAARRTNESLGNAVVELFEIARIYLPQMGQLPREALMLGISSGGDFQAVKGAIETILARINPALELTVKPFEHELLRTPRACALYLDGEHVGYLGEASQAGLDRFESRFGTTIAELRLAPLIERAVLVPQYAKQSAMPSITRDLNLVMSEQVAWTDVAREVRVAAGPLLEQLVYRDTYRDPQRLGAGRKSELFSVVLRDANETLAGEQADAVRDAIVARCSQAFGAQLRA
ncbi:MAG TPA: phenylalanine--tRNA ligase subunit beta [Pirellulales bacterium]|nr:phenylalanine--tRNA ligase subunit beta [Pirellulales bacterium]